MRVCSRTMISSVVLAASSGLDGTFLLSGSTASNYLIKAAFGYTPPPPADDSDGMFTDESVVTVVDDKGELVSSAGHGLGNLAAASYLHLSTTELEAMFHKVAADAAHRQKTESRTLTQDEVEKLVSGVVVTKAKTSGIKTSDYTKKKKKMTAGDDSFMEVDRNKEQAKARKGFFEDPQMAQHTIQCATEIKGLVDEPPTSCKSDSMNKVGCAMHIKEFLTKTSKPCQEMLADYCDNVACDEICVKSGTPEAAPVPLD